MRAMLHSGWIRLWIVLTCVLLVSVAVASSFFVWGSDVSYTFVTVTIADSASPEDRQLAESVKQEATTKIFTGQIQYSPILTLETLARHGAVTQVGVQWLEPTGWSFKDHDQLDVFDKSEIKATEIIGRVSAFVHHARLRRAAVFLATAFAASVATLMIGIGVSWIRKGFAKQ